MRSLFLIEVWHFVCLSLSWLRPHLHAFTDVHAIRNQRTPFSQVRASSEVYCSMDHQLFGRWVGKNVGKNKWWTFALSPDDCPHTPWHVVVTSHSRKQVQCRAAGSDLRYLVSEWFVVALFIATDSNIPMHLSGRTKCWYHDLQRSIVEVRRYVRWTSLSKLMWGQIIKWKDRL